MGELLGEVGLLLAEQRAGLGGGLTTLDAGAKKYADSKRWTVQRCSHEAAHGTCATDTEGRGTVEMEVVTAIFWHTSESRQVHSLLKGLSH